MEKMKELEEAITRAGLLDESMQDEQRFDLFYAKCSVLPIAFLEEAVKRHKAELRHLENAVIPTIMQDIGQVATTLTDGTSVKIVTEWNASTTGCDSEKLATWLDERGLGAILKRKHYISENDVERVQNEGVELFEDTSVHTGTLKATIREYYTEHGELPPEEACKVNFFSHAKISKK